MRKITIIILLLILPLTAHGGKRLHKEREYQEAWCKEAGGVTEYVLSDGTRVDCLTEEYAIEFDFADKWAEAIGQSLHYALKTGKKPGIVLIVEDEKDKRHIEKLREIAWKTNIKIWLLDKAETEELLKQLNTKAIPVTTPPTEHHYARSESRSPRNMLLLRDRLHRLAAQRR